MKRRCKFRFRLSVYYLALECKDIPRKLNRRGHKMIITKYLSGTFITFMAAYKEVDDIIGQFPIVLVEDTKGHVHEVLLKDFKFTAKRQLNETAKHPSNQYNYS